MIKLKRGEPMELLHVHHVSDVKEIMKKEFKPIDKLIDIPITKAVNRVLGEDIKSNEDVPGFHRSTVDGYAIKAKNSYGATEAMPSFFTVIGSVEMGKMAEHKISNGEAMYVPTGGMLPEGADAVVMIEDVEVMDTLLNVYKQVAPRENVIFKGEDVTKGQIILEKGHRLRPQDLGGLAAVGITRIKVYKKLKVGILSTGDEIVPPDTKHLAPGQIRDVNGISLSAAIEAMGGEVIYGGIVKDDYQEYLNKSQELFHQVDFLILSGGSSMGEKDYTSQVINQLGKPGVLVHGVLIKPGKPTILANCNGKPVMGLPGHPVSAYVLFDLFAVAMMKQLHGERTNEFPKQLKARVTRDVASQAGRTDFVRVQLKLENDELWATPVFGKSGLITNLVESDGVIEITQNKEGILQGEVVNITLYI